MSNDNCPEGYEKVYTSRVPNLPEWTTVVCRKISLPGMGDYDKFIGGTHWDAVKAIEELKFRCSTTKNVTHCSEIEGDREINLYHENAPETWPHRTTRINISAVEELLRVSAPGA